ncbi:MAG: radical SAM protein [Dehalococcoidia bacterium]|nr:radical SAM protein [Dehalococcoidia bacterium]
MNTTVVEEAQIPGMSTQSPEYVRLSLAAAMVLRASSGRFYRDVRLHCINLLLTYVGGCNANCAYCGLSRAREGGSGEKSFIRVDWPTLATDEVIARMVKYSAEVSRICVSMVSHRRAYEDTVDIVRRIRRQVDAPVSALIAANLFDRGRLSEFRLLGVDTIGIGLDATSEAVFERVRGGRAKGSLSWRQYWQVIEEARAIFGPFKVNAHLVVGVGETDRELMSVVARLCKLEVNSYLFSFYPEAESPMARRVRPALRRYRRIQLAKYLMEKGLLGAADISYNDASRIAYLSLSPALIEQAIATGEPFLTGGCSGRDGSLACTRPFGSYRPGEPFRDFPFQPTEEDMVRVRRDLGWSLLKEYTDGQERL